MIGAAQLEAARQRQNELVGHFADRPDGIPLAMAYVGVEPEAWSDLMASCLISCEIVEVDQTHATKEAIAFVKALQMGFQIGLFAAREEAADGLVT